MPKKGMRTLLFTPRKAITISSSLVSSHQLSTPKSTFSNAVMDRSLMLAETVITKWDLDVPTFTTVTSLFYGNRTEAREFIKCMNRLQKSMHFLATEDQKSKKLIRGQELMEIAMKRLKKEFRQILQVNRDLESLSPESSCTSTRSSMSVYEEDDKMHIVQDSILKVEDASNVVMVDLRTIAECMIVCGYGKECMTIYKLIRKSILDEDIYKLGIQNFSSSHVHKMGWHAVEIKIEKWLEGMKIGVMRLFNDERVLCDYIFSSSENIMESCFADISNECARMLFGFPEVIAKSSKKAPEKLFRLLDMYVAISNNWPEIESVFSFESSSISRSQATNTLIEIREFVRTDVTRFECALQKDASKTPVNGEGIDPLTTHVLNYILLLANYSNIFVDFLDGYSLPSRSSLPESLFNDSGLEDSTTLEMYHLLAWLVLVLLCKLETKSKLYNDVSLSYLFLATNLQHIITTVRASNLKFILNDDWLTMHEIKVKQLATNYEHLGWDHVIQLLPKKPTVEMSKNEVTEWFLRFNVAFEQAHRIRSQCIIPDRNLRDAIKVSVARKIVPIYQELYNRHKMTLLQKSNFTSVIKYSPEDVGNWL